MSLKSLHEQRSYVAGYDIYAWIVFDMYVYWNTVAKIVTILDLILKRAIKLNDVCKPPSEYHQPFLMFNRKQWKWRQLRRIKQYIFIIYHLAFLVQFAIPEGYGDRKNNRVC